MGIAFFMPTKRFQFARDGRQPEVFEPGRDENGEPHIFEFQEHAAVNLQRRGVGIIVDRKANYRPTDPAMQAIFDDYVGRESAHHIEAPVLSPGPVVRTTATAAAVPPPVAETAPAGEEHETDETAAGDGAVSQSDPAAEEPAAAPAPTGGRRKRK